MKVNVEKEIAAMEQMTTTTATCASICSFLRQLASAAGRYSIDTCSSPARLESIHAH